MIGDSFDRDSFNLEKTLGAFTSSFGSTAILSAWVWSDWENLSANIFKVTCNKKLLRSELALYKVVL